MVIDANILNTFIDALLSIDKIKANDIVTDHFKSSKDFQTIESLVIQALNRIGNGWNEGIYSLAQVYMSGVICEEIMERVLPESKSTVITYPRLAIGVLLDHHGLGKRIVTSVVRASGYELLDFGLGQTPQELAKKAIDHKVDILLISTLMLPSALKVIQVRKYLDESHSNIKIIVGGAPFRFDNQLWKSVGADACSDSATDIVHTIKKVVDSIHD